MKKYLLMSVAAVAVVAAGGVAFYHNYYYDDTGITNVFKAAEESTPSKVAKYLRINKPNLKHADDNGNDRGDNGRAEEQPEPHQKQNPGPDHAPETDRTGRYASEKKHCPGNHNRRRENPGKEYRNLPRPHHKQHAQQHRQHSGKGHINPEILPFFLHSSHPPFLFPRPFHFPAFLFPAFLCPAFFCHFALSCYCNRLGPFCQFFTKMTVPLLAGRSTERRPFSIDTCGQAARLP